MILRDYPDQAYRGMVYYQEMQYGNHKYINFVCSALSDDKCPGCSQLHEDFDKSKNIAEELEKSLISVGFKPTTHAGGTLIHVNVGITGNWISPKLH